MYVCIGVIAGGLLALLICIKKKTVRECALYLLILFGSSLLALYFSVTGEQENSATDTQIVRPEPGEASLSQEYELCVEELDISEPYEVVVENRHLTKQELDELFAQAIQELEQTFLGENHSLDRVTQSVVPTSRVLDGRVSVRWSFDNYEVLDHTGELQQEALAAEGTLVTVTAVLKYESAEVTHRFSIMVYPPEKTKIELFYDQLAQLLAEKNASTDSQFALPQEVAGYTLQWTKRKDSRPYEVLAFGFFTIVALAVGKKEDVRKAQAKRREELLAGYPQMLGQLALLIGAGMTVTQAWEKIVFNYENRQARMPTASGFEQPIYEEMRLTYYQIRDGIGERRAYELFGERLGIAVYRRFATLLVQNLRKGTAGLNRLLEKEMQAAQEEQESLAKKRGEEMQTKLLLPMMLMLALVVVMIMIPALASFQM